MREIKGVLFDCDGTLVDSQASICAAMDAAFAALSLPPPDRHRTRRVVGLSLPQAMARMLPDGTPALHDALADAYKAAFQDLRAGGAVQEPLYDGIADLVTALDDAGWMLGVATGKSDRGLAHCLAFHGLTDRFVTLQTADRHPSKPDPSMAFQAMAEAGAIPETTVMIGDTSFDMELARAANIRAIGVDWGYHDADELTAAGADVVVRNVADLRALLLGD